MTGFIAHVPANVFQARFDRLYLDRRYWVYPPFQCREMSFPFDRAFFQTAFDYASAKWDVVEPTDCREVFRAVKRWSIRNPEKATELFKVAEEYGSHCYRMMKINAAIWKLEQRRDSAESIVKSKAIHSRLFAEASAMREQTTIPILREIFSEFSNVDDPQSLIVRFHFLAVRASIYRSELWEEWAEIKRRWF